jgi:geranylgeranyl reductase family protein
VIVVTDVVVVGAGPAGTVAATVLARAGARVVLIDRATFPRPKLCGDTLNPGVLAILRRLNLAPIVETCGLKVAGMILTGDHHVTIEGRYPGTLYGRSIARADLDWALVRDAVAAGVDFIDGTAVREAIVENGGRSTCIGGVRVGSNGASRTVRAGVTICADGRHSTLAFALGLARHPARPRRWAIGAYAEQVAGMSAFGEMHIRRGRYIGVAPLPNGITNICLVKPSSGADPNLHDPMKTLREALAAEPLLRDRFAHARFVSAPTVLGPLAVDAVESREIPEGLLLAGDAAGFVDPMTGDGLRFAVRGGELAADAALWVLEHGWAGVHERWTATRRRELGPKRRFNRALRALVGSPLAVRMATAAAPYAPSIMRALILRAGDCDLALSKSSTTEDTEHTEDT